ncbi:MAG TPA: DNA polymerase III subunit delta [Steroidobacteraceae bacterium]|nr:DNA polymerase III subunit delta [Steroidobacteraceae bacterium]
MKLTSDTLAAHLEKQLLSAYLISGDEPLLTAEASDAVRARARAAGFTERETNFIDRVGDWNDVRASANNLSLFAERRIVEIRMPSAKPGTAGGAALVSLLESRDPDRLLLITTPKLDRDAQGSAWVNAVEANGALVQVWPVDASKLIGWLRTRCRRLKMNADDDALEILAERTEGNLLAAHQEIEKLRLLVRGDRVTAEDVLGSVADSARFDVFQLGECALSGDAARTIRMLDGLRAEGVEPTLVLWSLSKAMRDLWAAVTAPPGGQARAWPRKTAGLEKAQRRAPQLSFPRLTARAVRADRMIKGRLSGDAWDEMALLAMDICARPVLPLSRSMLK